MNEQSSIEKMTIVKSKKINTLTDEDFKESVNIHFKDPISLCFYGEDRDSQYYLQKFVAAADISEGINFGVINLDHDKNIKKRFVDVNNEDNPYQWARYIKTPFILTYRLGFPQAFYNGEPKVKDLKLYFENMSHLKGHKEDRIEHISVNIEKNIYLKTTRE